MLLGKEKEIKEGGRKMEKLESKVKWEESLGIAQERSRKEGKPILLDFFKDG